MLDTLNIGISNHVSCSPLARFLHMTDCIEVSHVPLARVTRGVATPYSDLFYGTARIVGFSEDRAAQSAYRSKYFWLSQQYFLISSNRFYGSLS